VAFEAVLVRSPGAAAWVFATVPAEWAPDVTGAFGRVPVIATVDGRTWATSVWHGRDGRCLLAVPAKVRHGKDDGDVVTVEVAVDGSRL
jgi:hypothetical protein